MLTPVADDCCKTMEKNRGETSSDCVGKQRLQKSVSMCYFTPPPPPPAEVLNSQQARAYSLSYGLRSGSHAHPPSRVSSFP
jgi:hypothetical protein